MASTSVEILISADDQATAKFKQVERSMMGTSKVFKESAGKAKASTEIIGTLATVTAGSSNALSGFAGELAMVTERLSAFSEVSEKGGAGALAFQAGIVAAAGALAFKLGKAIGDTIFQTEKMNAKFAESLELSRQLNSELTQTQNARFARDLADLEKITDLQQREAAAREAQARVDGDIATKKARIAKLTEEIEGRTETWTGWAASISGEYSKTTEILQGQLEDEKELLESLREQSKALSQAVTEEDKLAAAAEKRKQEAEAIAEYEKQAADYLKKAREEAEKKAEAQRRERTSQANQFLGQQDRVREQLAALRQQQQDAENAATPGLTATTGRLLSSRQGEGYPAKTAKNTEKIKELQSKLNEKFEDFVRLMERREQQAEQLAVSIVD